MHTLMDCYHKSVGSFGIVSVFSSVLYLKYITKIMDVCTSPTKPMHVVGVSLIENPCAV